MYVFLHKLNDFIGFSNVFPDVLHFVVQHFLLLTILQIFLVLLLLLLHSLLLSLLLFFHLLHESIILYFRLLKLREVLLSCFLQFLLGLLLCIHKCLLDLSILLLLHLCLLSKLGRQITFHLLLVGEKLVNFLELFLLHEFLFFELLLFFFKFASDLLALRFFLGLTLVE